MHRFILRESNSLVITDHKDENGLNNQKDNLRPCTTSKNKMNRGKQANNTSGFKGVSWHKRMKKWKAEIEAKGKIFFLGYFSTPQDAHKSIAKRPKNITKSSPIFKLMLIQKGKTKYHDFALTFDYEPTVVEYCQYLKLSLGWTEFQYDPDLKMEV